MNYITEAEEDALQELNAIKDIIFSKCEIKNDRITINIDKEKNPVDFNILLGFMPR